jgi:localization factor PodJL
MHNLAVLSASGDNRSASTVAAAKWFREAAAYGLVDSQYNLGILYERGLGVPKSVAEAYFWFALAARQNDAKAVEKRNAVAARLTSAEREKMDSIVADWTPKARIEDVNRAAPEPPVALEEDGTAPSPKPVATVPHSAVMRASWHPDVAAVAVRPEAAQTNSAQLNVIAEAQRLLAERGYDPGPVDGRPGPRTEAAVRSFQRRAGLAETGQITQSLIVKMAFLPL